MIWLIVFGVIIALAWAVSPQEVRDQTRRRMGWALLFNIVVFGLLFWWAGTSPAP